MRIALRRVAWVLGKPMTKALHTVFDSLDLIVDPGKVCEKCRDKPLCGQCYFKTRERMNAQLPIDPIKHDPVRISDMAGLTTEVEMKVNQVSVLVSKKIGNNFCSWSLSYGATAEVEGEPESDTHGSDGQGLPPFPPDYRRTSRQEPL
jgi:hypothetical protein